jgi:hypothetical protein
MIRKKRKMRMVDSKSPRAKPVVRTRAKRPKGRAGGQPLATLLNDAIDDIEAGVEFWKTLDGNRRAKPGHSPEFLNRGG